MAARMAKSWSSTSKQVFKICRNSGVPDTAATTAAQRAVVASNSSRLTSSVSSPSRSFKSLFETRRPASVFFRYLPHLLHSLDNGEREKSRDRERESERCLWVKLRVPETESLDLCASRLPGELACVQSLLPLHSAVASARMVPLLNATADTLLQGRYKQTNKLLQTFLHLAPSPSPFSVQPDHPSCMLPCSHQVVRKSTSV